MINTRFCPTVNGPLHLGHLYTILINKTEAVRGGGDFTIRYDDNTRAWLFVMTQIDMIRYKALMHEDMDWFGIQARWSSQSDLNLETERLAAFLGHKLPPPPFGDYVPAEVVGSPVSYYPYSARQTAEHAINDYLERVNWVIRGIDLLSEDCLYKHFVDLYGLPRVRTTYIPRLVFDGDTVSKTAGAFKLCDLRKAKADPKEIVELLAKDCLVDPSEGWTVSNIKRQPTLRAWAKEMLNGVSS